MSIYNPSSKSSQHLFLRISQLIEQAKSEVAVYVNSNLTLMYWEVGNAVNSDILDNQRAEYGKQIVATLSRQLAEGYGSSYSEKNLRRMMQFASAFPQKEIVLTASRKLSWSHFTLLIPLKDDLQKAFYMEMCMLEGWSVRGLRDKIDRLLFERTAISKKPDELAKQQIEALQQKGELSPDLVFRDPLILDFLDLKDTYSERNLEDAILKELESFIMELGQGFAFMERQKRMVIDHEDFYLDLLFFHRKLKRLVAIDLKLGKFKPAYKAQMELYLRWLEKNEMQEGEESPIGLILCAQGNEEQIELLRLEESGIKVAKYMTELPKRELLKKKLHQAIEISKARLKK